MAEQCKGVTKRGNRCKVTVGLENGFCAFHRDQARETACRGSDGSPEEPHGSHDFCRRHYAVICLVIVVCVVILAGWITARAVKRNR